MTGGMAGESTPRRRWTFWRVLLSLFLYLWVAMILGAVAAGLAALLVYDEVTRPGKPGPSIQVTVPEGATGYQVGALLKDQGLLEYEGFFKLALKLDTVQKPIRHGIYDLPKGFSAKQLLELLQEGPSQHLGIGRVQITVPEGLSIAQAAKLFPNPDAFIEATSAPALIDRLGIQAESLEGFLMPNTYFFDEQPAEQEMVERMVAQFEKEYDRLVAEIPGAEEYDKLSVVTVASLVEEESRVDGERAKVAAVVYNRLKKSMPLGMDATLQYALGKYGQRMLAQDKEVDSPYNTYKYAGLPPGPIASPGVSSLRAALQPAQVDYLYFVSNADGKTHTFSSTFQEHDRAVARYRREISGQRRSLRQRQPNSGS